MPGIQLDIDGKQFVGVSPGFSPEHIYIHLPFCRSKCRYCAFPSIAVAEIPEQEYLAALLLEFKLWQNYWPDGRRPLSTLYFGGGTPSLFSPSFFSEIIDFFARETGFTSSPELTLEANPADIYQNKITGYLSAGINRISLGAQTFNNTGLSVLGRRHDAASISKAVAVLRQAQVENLSLDLIYAWPGQGCAELLKDLGEIAILEPEHLSAYTLSYEPGCEITQAVNQGKILSVSEDVQLKMMRLLQDNLDNVGLNRYEVSNFSRGQKFQSRHNLAYWQLHDFLGLGAGACGGWRNRKKEKQWVERYCNTSDPFSYMRKLRCVDSGAIDSPTVELLWFDQEAVDLSSSFSEALMLGLRLRCGVELGWLRNEYGSEIVDGMISKARLLSSEKMVGLNEERLWITDLGMHLTDSIVTRLI